MKIAITGASGFIGSHLAAALKVRGHAVAGDRTRMGQPLPDGLLQDADVLVHCAHDFQPGTVEVNVAGSRLFFDAADHCRRIFVSSHSARPDAGGEYGISKYRIEQFWLPGGGIVVRPGLVIGPGGLFARNVQAIRRSRVIPLIDGGRDPVAVVAIADLSAAMLKIVEGVPGRAEHNLFNARMPYMRDIVTTVLKLAHKRAALLSIPFGMALAGVRAGEMLKLPLPFRSDSLNAMKLNRKPVHVSTLAELVDHETGLETAIATAMGLA